MIYLRHCGTGPYGRFSSDQGRVPNNRSEHTGRRSSYQGRRVTLDRSCYRHQWSSVVELSLLLGRPLVAPSISERIGTDRDVRSAVTIGPDTSVRPFMWRFHDLRRPVLIRLSSSCGVRSEIVGISTRNRSHRCPVSTSESLALFQ